MHHDIELTHTGRLLGRRQIETADGLREKDVDLTDEAHHWLNTSVALQAGTRLCAVFELLKVNPTLRDIYKHNLAADYVARYEAIRSAKVVPNPRENADPNEPAIETLVLSLHQEIRMPNGLLATMAAAQDPNAVAPTQYLNLIHTDPTQGEGTNRRYGLKDYSSHWHISGRSALFTKDTELWGSHYKTGSHIDYSVSFSFDQCVDLPLLIGAGSVTFTVSGQRRKDRLTVNVPLGTDQDPPSITLHELISAITYDFSFHGGPQETQAEKEKLQQSISELDDEHHAQDLSFGMAHVFCPEGDLRDFEAHDRELQDPVRYWDRTMVLEHTGWSDAELKSRRRQGRILELRAVAGSTKHRREAYPAEQFIPEFDAELLRFLSWVASMSCSEWATHKFLTEWTTPNHQGLLINGWAVLALPDGPITHEELTNEKLKGFGNRRAPMRPVFAPERPKRALVDAFDAFAAQRRRDYEQRDELEDED